MQASVSNTSNRALSAHESNHVNEAESLYIEAASNNTTYIVYEDSAVELSYTINDNLDLTLIYGHSSRSHSTSSRLRVLFLLDIRWIIRERTGNSFIMLPQRMMRSTSLTRVLHGIIVTFEVVRPVVLC